MSRADSRLRWHPQHLSREVTERDMASKCDRGQLVEIHLVVLKREERQADLPEETRKVPLEAWVKGRALFEAEIGQEVEIETASGRRVKGTLTDIAPGYAHTYGPVVPELEPVGRELRAMLKGGGSRG